WRPLVMALGVAFTALVCAGAQDGRVQPPQAPGAAPSPVRAEDRGLLERYCVRCHNDTKKTAGLSLSHLDPGRVDVHPEIWEKVVRKLEPSAMPPPGGNRPSKAAAAAFVAKLESALDRAAASDPNPGRPSVHRLNRAEYVNAVRDLLAVELDGP